jgi:hypothetical protein
MPAAKVTALPSDTGVPGLSRRRVWTAPEVTSHAAVVLTLPRLYLLPAPGPACSPLRPDLAAAVETALDVEGVLGPRTTAIELASVRRVTLDLPANTVRVEYAPARGGTLKTPVVFATAELADAAFGKLWRRLGPEFALRPPREDPWAVARAPVAFMAALLAGTGLAGVTLNALDDFALSDQWLAARLLPNWRVVCGLGGAAVAAAQVWLYRRLTAPPERLELVRN